MTPVLIAATMLATLLLFYLVLPLRRRLGDQREIVQDLQRRYESLERELVLAATKVQDQHQQMDHLANLHDTLKKNVGKNLRAFDASLDALREQQDTFADKMGKLAHKPQPSHAPTPVAPAIDSPQVAEVLNLVTQGKTSTEIARTMGMQVGEVDLIRGLKHFTGS